MRIRAFGLTLVLALVVTFSGCHLNKQVADIAASQLGQSMANLQPYMIAHETGQRGFWCDDFVTWVYGQAGIRSVDASWSYNDMYHRLEPVELPSRGDLVIIDLFEGAAPGSPFNHVGIFESWENGNLVIIEGNRWVDEARTVLGVVRNVRAVDSPAIVAFRKSPHS